MNGEKTGTQRPSDHGECMSGSGSHHPLAILNADFHGVSKQLSQDFCTIFAVPSRHVRTPALHVSWWSIHVNLFARTFGQCPDTRDYVCMQICFMELMEDFSSAWVHGTGQRTQGLRTSRTPSQRHQRTCKNQQQSLKRRPSLCRGRGAASSEMARAMQQVSRKEYG